MNQQKQLVPRGLVEVFILLPICMFLAHFVADQLGRLSLWPWWFSGLLLWIGAIAVMHADTRGTKEIQTMPNYNPQLSQAGFMDLASEIQQRMKTADSKKTLAAMPQAQQDAAWQLAAAAKNYVEVIEGR